MLLIPAIYARASTDKQGDTIEHQVQMIIEYAKRMNINISFDGIHIYEDDAESGYKTTLLQRPKMRKMLNDIDNGTIDIVFFKGISRFARDSGEAITTAKRLSQKGIRVVSIEESYDSSKDDPTMFQIYAVMAEQESRKTSIRVSLGNKQKARNGLWTGSTTPIGYIKVKDIVDNDIKAKVLLSGKHPQSLYPDPKTKEIVEKIFDLFVNEGYGRKRICHWLNSNGFKTNKGNFFNDVKIKDILSNEVYIGNIVYGKTRNEYIEVEETKRKKTKTIEIDRKDWAICEKAHEPIVEFEVFMKAQAIIKSKEGKYNVSKRFNAAKHPLTGLLKCGICGSPMICQKRANKKADGTKKEYRYYTCSTAHRNGRTACDQKNVVADDLESYIHDVISSKLKEVRNNPQTLEDIVEYDPNEEINKQLRLVEHNIANKAKNQFSLLEDKDLYDPETFRDINKKLKEELILLRKEKQDLLDQLKFSAYKSNKEDLIKKMDEFLNLNMDDISIMREVFHEWINEIIYDNGIVKIDQKFIIGQN